MIGEVTGEAAAATGLAAGTPVVAGCADHVASAFVAGISRDGDLLLKFGGAGDILLATAQPKPDPRLFLDYHLVPGLFMPNGCMACSGAVLNWIVRELRRSRSRRAAARQARSSRGGRAARRRGAAPAALFPRREDAAARPVCARHPGRPRPAPHARPHLARSARSRRVRLSPPCRGVRGAGPERAPRGRLGRRRKKPRLDADRRGRAGAPDRAAGRPSRLVPWRRLCRRRRRGHFAGWDEIARYVRPAGVVEPDPARPTAMPATTPSIASCTSVWPPSIPGLLPAS